MTRADRRASLPPMHVLVAGIGWLGKALAAELLRQGRRVSGVRRHVERQAALVEMGISPVVADLADPRAVEHLPDDVDAVVVCTAPTGGDLDSYRTAYVETNRTLLAWAAARGLSGYVYTGSSGVFGQDDGGDVDEETPVSPSGESAEVLVQAERLVLDAARERGVPTRVVRLTGLYGPGRTGIVERVRSGALGLGTGDDAWMNFCHRDDAVGFVLAALARGRDGAVYHGTDAHPTRRRDVVAHVAERLGVPPRIVTDEDRGPGGRRGANRRVLSEKSRHELAIELRYPSFREGLAPFLVT